MFARTLIHTLLVLTLAAPSLVADEKKYEVRFERPLKVGDKYKLVASTTFVQQGTVIVNGRQRPVPGQASGYSLTAVVEVLETTKSGGVKKARLSIDNLSEAGVGADVALLDRDSVVIGEKKGKDDAFTLQDGELPPAAHEALEKLVSFDKEDSISDDKAFGPGGPKAVGDTWKVNSKQFAKGMNQVGVRVKPDDIKGEVTLAGTTTWDKLDCLEMKVKLSMADAKPTDANLPAGMSMKESSAEMTGNMVLPQDTTLAQLRDNAKLVFHMTLTNNAGEGQPSVEVKTETTMTLSRVVTPVK